MLGKATTCAVAAAACCGAMQAQTPAAARTQPVAHAASGPASGVLATVSRADIKVGETVKDLSGQTVGVVKKVTASGAIISTGSNRAEVPFAGIRRSSTGLITSVTKAQIDGVERGQPQVPSAHDTPTMPEM